MFGKRELIFDFASASWIGRRTEQQDMVSVVGASRSRGLAIVADGVGGQAGGRLAAECVVSAVEASMDLDCEDPRLGLLNTFKAATNALSGLKSRNPDISSAATTLLAVFVRDDELFWASVGDSPLALVRRGKLKRLNADHSMRAALEKLVEKRLISAEDVRNDPRRNTLTASMNGAPPKLLDISKKPLILKPGDIVLAASDGLFTLEDAEIEAACSSPKFSADDISKTLINLCDAKADPDQDNTTVVSIAAS
ncbi:MAG: protein phosphatase 2C domain-containing protein [Pseudomonadota bacterium]